MWQWDFRYRSANGYEPENYKFTRAAESYAEFCFSLARHSTLFVLNQEFAH